jgi:hypothetical protein
MNWEVTSDSGVIWTVSSGRTALSAMSDVEVSNIQDGQVLTWSDTERKWVNENAGGAGSGANLGYTASPTQGIITSDTGTDAIIPAADGTNAGLFLPAEKTKLSGIEAGAEVNDSAAEILTKLLTVDGPGSGLDADTLDGLSSAAFALALGADDNYVTDAEKVKLSNLSGTNTGDQTSIVGITGTKSQFDTAVTDGNFMYVGDAPTAHTHPQSEITNLVTDLAAKAPIASPTFTGTVTTPAIVVSSETASKVAIFDGSKNIKSADTTTYPDLTELSYVKGVTSAIQTQLNAKASSTFIDCCSGFIETVADKTYKIVIKIPFACTINETVTMCASGTATATFKINTTALGGTANSVSSSEQTQAHASANSVAAGDDLQITISSNSSCLDMSFTIKFTRTI